MEIRTFVLFSVVLLGACAAQAQDVETASVATVPIEVTPADAFIPSATAAFIETSGGAPQVQLRRSSPYEARRALRNNTLNVLTIADPQAEISQQAVCGANSLTVTNYNVHCRILVTFPGGRGSCSAAKIAPNRLVTAGHCIYDKDSGGWPKYVDVYCTGLNVCGVARTTYGTNVITTNRYLLALNLTQQTDWPAWDMAVIRTAATLPGTALVTGQYNGTGTATARLTGYTGSRTGVNGCSGYSTCTQYSSTDAMIVTSHGSYTSNKMDFCAGHSGGGVVDSSGILVATVSAERYYSNGVCVNNYFVPHLVEQNVNEGTACTNSNGGVSSVCLSKQLPA